MLLSHPDDNIKVLELYEELIPNGLPERIDGRIVMATGDHNEFSAVRGRSVNICIIDINLQSEVRLT